MAKQHRANAHGYKSKKYAARAVEGGYAVVNKTTGKQASGTVHPLMSKAKAEARKLNRG